MMRHGPADRKHEESGDSAYNRDSTHQRL